MIRRYVRGEMEKRDVTPARRAPHAGARREELLLSLRGRDPPHEGGGDEARAASEERPRGEAAVGAPGQVRRQGHAAHEPPVRRRAVQGAVRQAQAREAASGRPVRRLGLGAQRVTLHAPVRVLAAGPVLEGALLHLRRRDRRDHQALRGERDPPGDRSGDPRQRDQRLRALGLRARVPALPPRPPAGDHAPHDRHHPRRRAQQLQSRRTSGCCARSSSARSSSSG